MFSKYLAEKEIKEKIEISNYLILRLGAIYGLKKPRNVLDRFLNEHKRGKILKVYSPLNIKLNFLHIKQLIYCIDFLIKNKKFGTYNVGNYKFITLFDLIKKLKKKFKNIKIKTLKGLQNRKIKYYIKYNCKNLKKIKYKLYYNADFCVY